MPPLSHACVGVLTPAESRRTWTRRPPQSQEGGSNQHTRRNSNSAATVLVKPLAG